MHLRSVSSTLMTAIYLTSIAQARKVTNPAKVPKNAVLLSNIASLTLRGNKLTSSRRVKAIPQLECVGPEYVCGLYKVDVMRCKNEGADYDEHNIQWACKASLPAEFKLGGTEVVCEGYESSDDPYVLKGSCGVEYRLLLTEKGIQKYGYLEKDSSMGSSNWFGLVFALIFAAVLFIIVRGIYRESIGGGRRPGTRHRPNGGGGDDSDPPPPYDGPPAYSRWPQAKQRRTTAGSSVTHRSSASSSQTRTPPQQNGWRPGFWTGAATGAAAGYGAYRYANRSQPESSPSAFGSGRAASSSSNSRPSPSYSSERHESTGFGGSRRR